MFASQSLTEHVLRGISGFSLFALAVWLAPTNVAALLFVPAGLVLLRGCPMCWTIGLVETIMNTVRRHTGHAAVELCETCVIDRCEDEHATP